MIPLLANEWGGEAFVCGRWLALFGGRGDDGLWLERRPATEAAEEDSPELEELKAALAPWRGSWAVAVELMGGGSETLEGELLAGQDRSCSFELEPTAAARVIEVGRRRESAELGDACDADVGPPQRGRPGRAVGDDILPLHVASDLDDCLAVGGRVGTSEAVGELPGGRRLGCAIGDVEHAHPVLLELGSEVMEERLRGACVEVGRRHHLRGVRSR